jgi:hypothetical protein
MGACALHMQHRTLAVPRGRAPCACSSGRCPAAHVHAKRAIDAPEGACRPLAPTQWGCRGQCFDMSEALNWTQRAGAHPPSRFSPASLPRWSRATCTYMRAPLAAAAPPCAADAPICLVQLSLPCEIRGEDIPDCQGGSVPAGLHAAPVLPRRSAAGPAAAGRPRDRARARAGCARRGRTRRTTCARAAARWRGRWRGRRRRRRARRGRAPRRRARAHTGGAPTCPTRRSGASTSAATCPSPWNTAA